MIHINVRTKASLTLWIHYEIHHPWFSLGHIPNMERHQYYQIDWPRTVQCNSSAEVVSMDLSMTSAMEILVTNRHDPYVKMSITSLLDHHINNIHGENIRERESNRCYQLKWRNFMPPLIASKGETSNKHQIREGRHASMTSLTFVFGVPARQ
jgi:hypothetical protein